MEYLGFKRKANRTFKQKQEGEKLPEYQKRKQELLNKLKLEESQKHSKELLIEYKKVSAMRRDYLMKIKEADKHKKQIYNQLSDVTTKILMTNDKEEEKQLLDIKNNYKQQLEQLDDLDNINIFPTIKRKLEELKDSSLSNKAQIEWTKLDKKIVKELEDIRKEAREKKLMYKNLEADLLNIQEQMYYGKVREEYRDLNNPSKARPESNHKVRYVTYIQESTGEKRPY